MYADGTMICPLCSRLARTTSGGLLYLHFGREMAVAGYQVRTCDASRRTPEEAQKMAETARAELNILRLRAHP